MDLDSHNLGFSPRAMEEMKYLFNFKSRQFLGIFPKTDHIELYTFKTIKDEALIFTHHAILVCCL